MTKHIRAVSGLLLPALMSLGVLSPDANAATVGATVPFLEYEAENAVTNGTIIGPDRTYGTFAAESSGRQAVRLDATGKQVEFKSQSQANSIVVRYVIPDAPTGGGINATLSLYVNGARHQLNLTSRYSWNYSNKPTTINADDPTQGHPHHFYDECRLLGPNIPPGATVTLKKESSDTAAYYIIDLIDLEQVAAPLPLPANFLSITAYGATANDATDDTAAIQNCVNAAQSQGKGVWIPPGTFRMDTGVPSQYSYRVRNMAPLVKTVTVRGAGMWHSTLKGLHAGFSCSGTAYTSKFHDFSILGEETIRDAPPENIASKYTIPQWIAYDSEEQNSAFWGSAGTGSWVENIWIEHMDHAWFMLADSNQVTIRNNRVRNIFSDGFNLAFGTSYCLVEHNHLRACGDAAIVVIGFPGYRSTRNSTGNTIQYNTSTCNWWAGSYGTLGAKDTTIQYNYAADTLVHPGMWIGQSMNCLPLEGYTRIIGNTLVRCGGSGGPASGYQYPAFFLEAYTSQITGLDVRGTEILDATWAALRIKGPYAANMSVDGMNILRPKTWGVQIDSNAIGTTNAKNVNVTSPGSGTLTNASNGRYLWKTVSTAPSPVPAPAPAPAPAPPPSGANSATAGSVSVPTSMTAGQTYSVSVSMTNNGTSTWTAAANYKLGSQNPQDNSTWGTPRVLLASGDAIAPNQTKTFTYDVKAPATAGSYNFQWRMVRESVQWFGAFTGNVAVQVSSAPAQSPYGGKAWAIPGTIQARNYDVGGEGISYHDTTSGNAGGTFRADGVDLHANMDGGTIVGWTKAGEWLEYTVNVATTGDYSLEVRVSSLDSGGTFHIEFDGVDKTGAIAMPTYNGTVTWMTLTKPVSLAAGQQVMRIALDANGTNNLEVANLNHIRLVAKTPTGAG
jgi:hypothetical protein